MPKFRTDTASIETTTPKRVEIIAEVGSSHGGDYNTAEALAEAAIQAGADTVKFQLFSASTLWNRTKMPERWDATYKLALPLSWLKDLKAICESAGGEFLCTPFFPDFVPVLEKIGVKRYKVASGDVTYIPLLKEISKTGKPVLLSVGFSTDVEIEKAIEALRPTGNRESLTLMHCVGQYPCPPEFANLQRILDLTEKYTFRHNCRIGYSSHVREWWTDMAAIAYGVVVIEKHICSSQIVGPEDGHSLVVDEFADFAQAVRDTESAIVKQKDWSPGDVESRYLARRDPRDWLRPNG